MLGIIDCQSLENKLDTALKCHHKLSVDNVDFKDYYDATGTGPDTIPGSVNMLRFKGDDDVFKCALYLKGCVKGCGCTGGTEALLINSDQSLDTPDAWSIECKELETYTKVEQRSVADSNAVPKPKAQTADGVVGGDVPPTDSSSLLSIINQANNPAPKVTSKPVTSSNVIADTDNPKTATEGTNDIKSLFSDLNDLMQNPNARSLGSEDPDTVLTTEAVEEKTTTTAKATAATSTTTTAKATAATSTTTTTAKATAATSSTTTTTTTTTTKTKTSSTTTAEPVTTPEAKLKKDERVMEKDGDVLEDDVDELGALQTKYYVVVAFVVVFVLILVFIAVVLFIKMKKTRGGMQIISPGPMDQEPLTPSGNQGAFKFDGDRT